MNEKEIILAFMGRKPVIYNDIRYAHISAVIHRHGPNGVYIQVELQDKNDRSVVIAAADRIRFARKEDNPFAKPKI